MTNIEEIWKDIIGYEGLYQVSNLGRIKSLQMFITPTVKRDSHLILKQSIMREYYGVSLSNHIKPRKSKAVHILVAKAFIPNPENKPQVNHKDGNKLNNHVSNLEWATPSENTIHAYENGLIKNNTRGVRCHQSKLNENDVFVIRKLVSEGINQYKIAEKFNIKQSTVSCIASRKTWKHVK